ncbi:unnamed protein product [Miscanthus lutarioriparius]|uniref:Uncharacterized protein n=1 Tax=Miscanthus lutarioriparius TaxID=422564 RepID=A0A811R7N8_9POAL|nr:unnamed protein product [Miscanthus lutarioriparius]
MAQGLMPEAGTAAGARGDLEDRARPRPEAMPSAYGGIEAGRLVVRAKPLPSGAGYYQLFAVVRFEDLPEELRRIAGASGHGVPPRGLPAPHRWRRLCVAKAKETPGGTTPRTPSTSCRRRDSTASCPDWFPPGPTTSRPSNSLATETATPSRTTPSPSASSCGYKLYLPLMEEDGTVVVHLDASRLQVLGDKEGSLFQKEKGFSHAWMGHSGDEVRAAHGYMGAFYDNSLLTRENAAPVVALLLGNDHIAGPRALDSCSDGLASPREDAVPFVTEQSVYYYDVLLPPENVVPAAEALRAPRSPTYAVQVSVDAAAGGKAGDPPAVGVKAAGADDGHEHGGSLSAVLGIVVASSAATALAASTVGPAAAFGMFAALVGGLSLAMASVRGR